ncbi:MAG: DUF4177 domain-containing protein [Clostridiales bacterium]|nr:DUF4177 domain-containing protein [Clostridiales bacterium]
MKQYKLVAGPTTSQFVGKTDASNDSDAVNSFQNVISQYAAQGWSYHSMEPINMRSSETKGCLFNKQTIYHEKTFYMLVFEKDI